MSWLETHGVFIVGFALAIVATFHMLSQRRNPQSTAAWLIAIFAFPWLGVPLYLMLGGRKMRRLMDSKADLGLAAHALEPTEQNRVQVVLRSLGIPAASDGNAVNLHVSGSDAARELYGLIDNAVDSIWYSTFIFAEDEIGREVLRDLTRKAAKGVEVRLLLDGVGSLHTKTRFLKPLIDAGEKSPGSCRSCTARFVDEPICGTIVNWSLSTDRTSGPADVIPVTSPSTIHNSDDTREKSTNLAFPTVAKLQLGSSGTMSRSCLPTQPRYPF